MTNPLSGFQKILVFIIALAIVGGGYLLMQNKAEAPADQVFEADQPAVESSATTIEETAATSSTPEVATTTELKKNNIINKENKVMTKATFATNFGSFTIEFLPAQAPNTVANFVKLAEQKFYDGTRFHRVIKDFMIQGGDPQSKDLKLADRWGTGGPGYQFADEISATNHNDVGTIAMANSGPNTNGSQFFVNTAANNFLDGKHTVFGRVVSGMDVIKEIEANPTGPNDRPVKEVVIEKITFSE